MKLEEKKIRSEDKIGEYFSPENSYFGDCPCKSRDERTLQLRWNLPYESTQYNFFV